MREHLIFDARHITKGGIGVYIRHHLDYLTRSMTFESIVILCNQGDDVEEFICSPRVRALEFPRLFSIEEQIAMRRLIREYKRSVYFSPHVTFPFFPFCPTVLTVHDVIWLKYPKYAKVPAREYFRLMLWRATKVCDRIICISEATARDMQEFFHCRPDKLAIVHNGCESADPSAKPKAEPIGKYWLYVGNWKPWKNVPVLIEAFEHYMDMQQQHEPCELVLVGESANNMSDDIVSRVGSSRYRDNISIRGRVSDSELKSLLSNAYALVHPAEYEGFGLTILEAMRVGTPVITTSGGSLPEVAGDAAIVVHPGSAESLASAMKNLSGDAGLYCDLSTRGLRQVEGFSWMSSSERTLQVFEKLRQFS